MRASSAAAAAAGRLLARGDPPHPCPCFAPRAGLPSSLVSRPLSPVSARAERQRRHTVGCVRRAVGVNAWGEARASSAAAAASGRLLARGVAPHLVPVSVSDRAERQLRLAVGRVSGAVGVNTRSEARASSATVAAAGRLLERGAPPYLAFSLCLPHGTTVFSRLSSSVSRLGSRRAAAAACCGSRRRGCWRQFSG